MARVIMVIGGSSSGKSQYAEEITAYMETQLGWPVYYLATARVTDEEFADRVERHLSRRPSAWSTIEEPLDPARVMLRIKHQPWICLLDGVGTWISNILIESMERERAWDGETEADCLKKVYDFIESLRGLDAVIVMVADEVGWDLAPGYELGRVFMELNGNVNQILARAANEVFLVASGNPVFLKGGGKA